MKPLVLSRRRLICLLVLACVNVPAASGQDDANPPDSALVKLLKSGRVPESRREPSSR